MLNFLPKYLHNFTEHTLDSQISCTLQLKLWNFPTLGDRRNLHRLESQLRFSPGFSKRLRLAFCSFQNLEKTETLVHISKRVRLPFDSSIFISYWYTAFPSFTDTLKNQLQSFAHVIEKTEFRFWLFESVTLAVYDLRHFQDSTTVFVPLFEKGYVHFWLLVSRKCNTNKPSCHIQQIRQALLIRYSWLLTIVSLSRRLATTQSTTTRLRPYLVISVVTRIRLRSWYRCNYSTKSCSSLGTNRSLFRSSLWLSNPLCKSLNQFYLQSGLRPSSASWNS